MPQTTALSKEEMIAMLSRSVDEWNKYRRTNAGPVDLTGADISGANLTWTNLTGADLTNAQYAYARQCGSACHWRFTKN